MILAVCAVRPSELASMIQSAGSPIKVLSSAPTRPTWISTFGSASMLNSHPGGRSEPPLEATTR